MKNEVGREEKFQKQFWSGCVGFGGYHQDFRLVFMLQVRPKEERERERDIMLYMKIFIDGRLQLLS